MNTDIVYKYIGNGGFVVGAPARDIAEWELMQDPGLKAIIEENLSTPGPCWERVPPPATVRKVQKAPVNVTEEVDKTED